MDKIAQCLLNVLCSAIENRNLQWCEDLSIEELCKLLKLSSKHKIFPLVIDTLFYSSFSGYLKDLPKIQQYAKTQTVTQAQRTADFLLLLKWLENHRLNPIVIKGIVCRSLYPKPELRASIDEDLWIRRKDLPKYHKLLLAYGLKTDPVLDSSYHMDEISYRSPDNHLYVELHMSLFPSNSAAYSDLNILFGNAFDRQTIIEVYGQKIQTLAPTDHFLYLLCHAYKHFLHAGVGIRQVADMALFANEYGEEIDWDHIFSSCQKVHIETFAAGLLQIMHKHLTPLEVPIQFAEIQIDEEPLLEDILTGGLYGMSDIDRVHSSNITLDAVAARRQGRKRRGVWHSIFPGKTYLQNHYAYAKKYPILLPAAWADRIIRYLRQKGAGKGNPAQTLQIGQERIALMKYYKIL